MSDLTVASGETLTVESGETEYGSPVNVGGQLNVGGEVNTYPALSANMSAGATATFVPDSSSGAIGISGSAGATMAATIRGEKAADAAFDAGASGDVALSGEKSIQAEFDSGAEMVPDLDGEKDIAIDLLAGATFDVPIEFTVPLWRTNSGTLDADRTDEFTAGLGEMDDG